MKTTTVIVNHSNDVLKVKVGSHQHNAQVASIDKGGQWNLQVDVNETYREFRLQDPRGTKVVIVSSDDCCDYERITIKDAAAAGDDRADLHPKFEVHRVPRRAQENSSPENISLQVSALPTSEAQKTRSGKLTWFGWIRHLWMQST